MIDRTPSPAYQPGHHWVSPTNFDPELRESYAFPKPLTIFDSTLRKIIYTSGLRPSVDDLLHVAEALQEVGIREMTLNVDWWGDRTPDDLEYEVCRAVLARDFAFHATVHADAFWPHSGHDLEQSIDSARQSIDTLLAVGMDTMELSMGDPWDEAQRARQIEGLARVFSYGQSLGLTCILALVDVGRMDFEYLVRLANEGIRLGSIRLNLVDSYSSLSPEGMKLFLGRLKTRLAAPVPMSMHVHNDFGMGSATAVAAASAGAHPDVAVNGLSYRAGFAALEEVAVTLELLYGVPTGLRLDYLQRLSDIVAQRIGLPTHPLKPITGAHAFLRDLPIWMPSYLKVGPEGFPPPGSCFAPSVVGARMWAAWGIHHPASLIRAKLGQMGLNATEEQVLEIRRRIGSGVQALDGYPHWLSEETVEAICRAVVG